MNIRLIIALLLLSYNSTAQKVEQVYKFSKHLEEELQKDTTPWKYQMGATNFSISGHYKNALETWNKNGVRKTSTTEEDSLKFSTYKSLNARDIIIEKSKTEQIIIINEAHHNASHRTFTKSLLQGLYDNGYRYLGLEALFDSSINTRKFPVMESGIYTREPEFGNMISAALKLGFIVFGYEASAGKNGKEREIEQAQNIKRFIDSNNNGKVLIHCGYAHVNENFYKPWEKAMAGRLKEFTGIDPYTINQETFSEKGSFETNPAFVNLNTSDEVKVLIDQDGQPFNGSSELKQTDLVVIHPVTRYKNNRPHWLANEKLSYTVPVKKIKNSNLLVMAYRQGEYEKNGIPADILEIKDQHSKNELFLAPGKYEIVLKDVNYKVINTFDIDLK